MIDNTVHSRSIPRRRFIAASVGRRRGCPVIGDADNSVADAFFDGGVEIGARRLGAVGDHLPDWVAGSAAHGIEQQLVRQIELPAAAGDFAESLSDAFGYVFDHVLRDQISSDGFYSRLGGGGCDRHDDLCRQRGKRLSASGT